jgi:outer membrane protein TolC
VASGRAAAQSIDITRKQVQLGRIAYLSVLNAQYTCAQARLAQANRLAAPAALSRRWVAAGGIG